MICTKTLIKASVEAVLTCVVQVEGKHEVQEDVRQLLCGIRGMPVLHHTQQKLNKLGIQVFCKQGESSVFITAHNSL